jgi:hypothetical protein
MDGSTATVSTNQGELVVKLTRKAIKRINSLELDNVVQGEFTIDQIEKYLMY